MAPMVWAGIIARNRAKQSTFFHPQEYLEASPGSRGHQRTRDLDGGYKPRTGIPYGRPAAAALRASRPGRLSMVPRGRWRT
jgi:hypothetical protein